MDSETHFLPGFGPFESWFASERESALEAFLEIRRMALAGDLGGEKMPEDANPRLPINSAENYRFFTLVMALNFQRNSYRLWESALETFQDPSTKWTFDPHEVTRQDQDSLRDALVKHKLALQPTRHSWIWHTISSSLADDYGGDVRLLFSSTSYDAAEILDIVRHKKKRKFPYLSGPKICNYWLHVMERYTDVSLENRQAISVAPDTHVIQASIRLGLVRPDLRSSNRIQGMVNEAWSSIISGTDLVLIDVHGPLWLWSKSSFHNWKRIRKILKT